MSSERKALQDKAYPEVLAHCRRLGFTFEALDLRWGVRGVPSGDHEAGELFLQEIQNCRRTSAGPDFVWAWSATKPLLLWAPKALLGNRYGHRALPRLVPEKQFEALLSKLAGSPDGAEQLERWFLKDSNAVPPTYVLQPITAHFPFYGDLRLESRPQRDDHVLGWRRTETQLLQLLRAAATDAEAAGDITAEQKHRFYASVTEQELELGLWAGDAQPSALVFVRETPRQRAGGGAKRLARFVDVTAEGPLDAEAQGLLSGLKSRLYGSTQDNLNRHCVELSKGGVDPKRRDHAHYLDSVCQQFVSHMKARVGAAAERRGNVWGSVEELSDWAGGGAGTHAVTSAKLCRGVSGREGLLGKLCFAVWEATQVDHAPLVVHGAAGMGKTTVLCKLAQEMRGVVGAGPAVVIRLLSIGHPQRPDIEHVLRGVCLHVCVACGLAPPSPLMAGGHAELLRFFQNVLAAASQRGNTLLVILDGLDRLSARRRAHELRWLPTSTPPHVHLVVSMDTDSQAFASMRLKLPCPASYFEVERLSHDEGKQILEAELRGSRRTLSPEQSAAVLRRFDATGHALHLKLMLSAARRWASYTPLTGVHLGADSQEVMSQLLLTLEKKHGKELVAGALGYISLSRAGLLEAELRDVMSLDDDVIFEVYRYSLPPTPSLIRLPAFLWARLRRDLEEHLEERWTGGVASITFSNWRMSEAVSAQYLTSDRRGRSLRNLAEYFLGRWSGKLKPVSLPGLSVLLADRKVPPQPLWFAPGLANVRKLQELPYHLLHAGLWEDLQQEVIGSAEWLFCQSRVCGVSSVIQDLDQCSQYMDCMETGLVRDTLVLMKPTLDFLKGHMDMSLFYTELLARLCSLATPFPSLIGRLVSQCEDWLLTNPEPVLIPKCSFLQQPGGALQSRLTGLDAGVLCLDVSVGAGLLLAGSDDGVVGVWSLDDQQLVHFLLGHTGAVLSIKVIDDSAHCLTVATDRSLRRWDLTSGQQLQCIQEALPADPAPSSVHLHLSEPSRLLFISTRSQVRVWKLDAAELVSSGPDGGGVVLGVLGEAVVSLSDGGRVRISHPAGGTGPVETPLEEGRLSAASWVSLPRHGQVFVVSEGGVLHQISGTGRHAAVQLVLVPSLLSVTEDENILMAGCDRTLSLFHVDPLDRFLDLHHEDSVLSACVSSDGRTLVSGAADQLIRIWSVLTGTLLDTLCGSEAPVTSVVLHGDLVISASTGVAWLHLWSLKYDARHKAAAHIPAGCAHAAVTKDASQVFYVRQQSQTEIISWNNLTGSLSERLSVSAEVCCLELAQHKRLLLCGLTTGTTLIYPLALPQETLCIPPPESLSRVLCMAVSPQERHVAVAYEDVVRLFEITTRDGFPRVEGPLSSFPLSLLQAALSSMALLPDRRLVYGTGCGEVKLYDFRNGSSAALEPHHSRVTCVTGSNWGGHALVGSEDAVQRLWSLKPLALDHTMEYKGFYFEGVLSAAFSDSDQFVFTGSQDRTVKVWDVKTGTLLLVQYVYSPVVRMVTYRNGFVALSQQGAVLREVFRCPEHIGPDYNPLRNVKAQYRVTSREKEPDGQQSSGSELQGFNPAQFNLKFLHMLRTKPSATCLIL
ncbi:NACHT domain- and WD repeat-containing protein 1 [Brachionichthys hirsutus]|uniref:NACHT domain- and WD repeat-containing protein 1 n=1 Tax=Brachionichthys hirsutus TaxID=412623 RepID=UPI003604D613